MSLAITELRTQSFLPSYKGIIAMNGFRTFHCGQALFLWGIWFVSSLSLSGQTGPGGVGSSTNNQLWLRIDSNVYSDAGITAATNATAVYQWEDYSGNNHHAIQTTSSDRPTLRTNQVNGFNVLQFDGSNDRILSTGLSNNGSMIVFTVIISTSLTNNNDGVIQGSPAGQAFTSNTNDKSVGMWISRSTSRPWGRGIQSDNTQRNISETTVISTNTAYIITNDYNGSTIQQYINGSTAGSVSYNGTLKDWSDFGIGRQGTESFTGYFAEVIVYNTSPNNAQRTIIDNYLAAKFGLALGANDFYTMDNPGNGNYDFEVAGIGRAASGTQTQTISRGSGMVLISKSGGGLSNDEYLIWGHEGGPLNSFGYTDVPSGVMARLGRKWRISEQGEVGDITLAFDLTGLGSVTTTDLRLLIDADGDGDFSDATAYSSANNIGSNLYEFTVTSNNLEDGYGFTIATINTTQTPLPVTLLNFDAFANGNEVLLQWTTLSEINNDKFLLRRSEDTKEWVVFDSLNGAGTSHERKEYYISDKSPRPGLNYYQLVQRDFNGHKTYSEIRAVDLREFRYLIPYPNPFNNRLHLALPDSSDYQIEIFDMQGRQTIVPILPVGTGIIIDFSGKSAGTYLMKIRSGNQVVVRKIIFNPKD